MQRVRCRSSMRLNFNSVQSLSVSYLLCLLPSSLVFWVSVNLRSLYHSSASHQDFYPQKVRLNGSFMQILSTSRTIGLLRGNENWELAFFALLSASLSWLRACVSEVQMHSFGSKLTFSQFTIWLLGKQHKLWKVRVAKVGQELADFVSTILIDASS